MFEKEDSVRDRGQWDPNLDAYRVVDPKSGDTSYYVWKKPEMFLDAVVIGGMSLFWVGVAAFVYLLFFQWPDGVAGDRRHQLRQALGDRYRVDVTYLPESWSASQVFTVDIEQDWDNPKYDEPAVPKRACKLQPGATADDLSLQCPNMFGTFEEVREGGLNAEHHRETKRLLEPDPATPANAYPGSDYSEDPYEQYEPDPYDYYEPEEMYP